MRRPYAAGLIVALVLVLVLIPSVSADLLDDIREPLELLGGLIFFLFGGEWAQGIPEQLVVRGSFGLLVFILVFFGLEKIKVLEKKPARVVVGLVIGITGSVFLPAAMVALLRVAFPAIATTVALGLLFSWLYVGRTGPVTRSIRVARILTLILCLIVIGIFRSVS